MKRKIKNLVVIITLVISFLISNQIFSKGFNAKNSDIQGIWQGQLKVPGAELRIVFKVSENQIGNLKASLDSPDQGAKDINVDTVIYNDGNIRFEVKIVNGYYEGKFNSDSNSISGNWHQNGYTFPLSLKKIEKVEEVKRPQEPKPPFPYKVEDVIYENKTAGIKLGGTLTLPESGEQFAAVLLITGSGQQNRDEELLGHKPFLVLADYLTRRGIAVLRVDDRGNGESTGNFAASTTKDFAGDVLAGVEYLKNRKEINPAKIGLIGHSEGGVIAPMVASECKDVSFIVLMAGTGVPGDQIIYSQTEAIEKASNLPEERVKEDVETEKEMYAVLKVENDSLKTIEKLRKKFDDAYSKMDDKRKSEIGDPDKAFDLAVKSTVTPWFRYFISYDPAPALEKVKCPVLALNGSKDLQVLPGLNLPAIKKALEKGGNKNFEVKELPGLNHLFQTAETGNPSEYSKIEETISPKALQTISDWILENTK
jgi:pimeloyl-ACP methyl ester carboxylesterase